MCTYTLVNSCLCSVFVCPRGECILVALVVCVYNVYICVCISGVYSCELYIHVTILRWRVGPPTHFCKNFSCYIDPTEQY